MWAKFNCILAYGFGLTFTHLELIKVEGQAEPGIALFTSASRLTPEQFTSISCSVEHHPKIFNKAVA